MNLAFNSFWFIILFPAAALIYYLLPGKLKKGQWILLLLLSLAFYAVMAEKYVFLLLASAAVTWGLSLFVEKKREKRAAVLAAEIIGLVLNVGLLFACKYVQPLFLNLGTALQSGTLISAAENYGLIAPLGISFYIFRTVSYLIDVRRGTVSAQRNPLKYLLYVSFFPQILSGPIERAGDFFPETEKSHTFDYEKVKSGAVLFLWGLMKKIVIADRMAILTDKVFSDVDSFGTKAYAMAVLLFTLQIYFDFSGYSDMANGCMEILDMRPVKNFEHPYFAGSVSEFWRKWHVSLSAFFRDYLYFPLGGSRVGFLHWAFNIMVVFLVSGLWHGAGITFIVWGAIHGIYQIIGKGTRKLRDACLGKLGIVKSGLLYRICGRLVTFALVAYAWLWFKAGTLSDALHISKHLLIWDQVKFSVKKTGLTWTEIIFSLCIAAAVFIAEGISERKNLRNALPKWPLPVRWLVYLVLLFLCIMFGVYGTATASSFIYFQF